MPVATVPGSTECVSHFLRTALDILLSTASVQQCQEQVLVAANVLGLMSVGGASDCEEKRKKAAPQVPYLSGP